MQGHTSQGSCWSQKQQHLLTPNQRKNEILESHICLYHGDGCFQQPNPVRMTPFPPRLQITLDSDRGHLDGENEIWRAKCIANCFIPCRQRSVRITPFPHRLHTSWTGCILMEKMKFGVLNKSCSYKGDSEPPQNIPSKGIYRSIYDLGYLEMSKCV